MKPTRSIILAAGQGTRMRSKHSKVLHEVCGDSLIGHVIRANVAAGIDDLAVIVGFQAEKVAETLPENVSTFLQAEQKGTGHAVMQAMPFLEGFNGNVLILVGDAPLVRSETLKGLVETHEQGGFGATVLTAEFDDPTGYGRMIKEGDALIKIVEHKDATEEERQVKEINSGMYCFDAAALRKALTKITTDNAQGEYYLTDTIEIIRGGGGKVGTYPTPDPEDIAAVNSKVQLAEVRAIMQRRINKALLENGVTIIDPATTYIGVDTHIGQDSLVYPGVTTIGQVNIGADCVIEPGCFIQNTDIVDGTTVTAYSVIKN